MKKNAFYESVKAQARFAEEQLGAPCGVPALTMKEKFAARLFIEEGMALEEIASACLIPKARAEELLRRAATKLWLLSEK